MWSAIRADFSEFVSTVTEDTSNVLSQIDSGLGTDEDEENANEISMDSGESVEEDSPKRRPVNHAELKEIMKLLRDHPGTYTEDLADEDDKEGVDDYLKNFSIEARTDEIAEVLKEHQDTVQKQFEELCPTQVSYEEFWKRYFYRCDEERIIKQLQEETERARQARAEAIAAGVKSVTNFFGGAMQAVTSTIAPEGGEPPEGINLFGAKGRPPFVMNTAVSESGDDEEGDDEEEDLGWGSDDDDDDDLEFDQAAESAATQDTEQIEFTDKVSEDLQEKLKQAIEERDQIQQTVQMQANEIKLLQNKLSGNPDLDSASEVEELKLKLFEKDAELAALKARVHDEHVEEGGNKVASLAKELGKLPADQLAELKAQVFGTPEASNRGDATKISALEKQVQELSQTLDTKDAALATATDKLAAATKELEATRSQLSSDMDANAAMAGMEAKLKATQQSLEASQAESAQLKQKAQSAKQESATQISLLQQELAVAQQKAASLTQELGDTTQKLKQSEDALMEKNAELQAATRGGGTPPTPDTVSTGVKVPAPAATKLDMDESEGDGWDDDW